MSKTKIVEDTRAYAHIEHQSLSAELKVMRRQQRKLIRSRNRVVKTSIEANDIEPNARLSAIDAQIGWWQKRKNVTKLYARAYNLIVGYLKNRAYEQIETIRYTDVPPAILGRCITDVLENDQMTAFYKWYAKRPAINGVNHGAV